MVTEIRTINNPLHFRDGGNNIIVFTCVRGFISTTLKDEFIYKLNMLQLPYTSCGLHILVIFTALCFRFGIKADSVPCYFLQRD